MNIEQKLSWEAVKPSLIKSSKKSKTEFNMFYIIVSEAQVGNTVMIYNIFSLGAD